jgi:hypothetical protein
MRMWLVNPTTMCRNHLLGEHLELHMLASCLRNGKNIKGYIEKGFVDPSILMKRHEELVEEMKRREYSHSSPIGGSPELLARGHINTNANLTELVSRCHRCRERKELADSKERNNNKSGNDCI